MIRSIAQTEGVLHFWSRLPHSDGLRLKNADPGREDHRDSRDEKPERNLSVSLGAR